MIGHHCPQMSPWAAPLPQVHPPENRDLGVRSLGCKLRSDVSSHHRPGNRSETPPGDAFPERAHAWENRKVSAYAFLWAPNMRFQRMEAWAGTMCGSC